MTTRRITPAPLLALLALSACPIPVATAQDASPRDRYFDGLRQRGLFSLAESVCFEELARKDLDPDARLEWTLQLSRTHLQHAQVTAGTQQRDLWNRARVVLEEFGTMHPKHPETLRVRVQAALIPLAHGGYLARLADLAPLDRDRRGRALLVLQQGIDQLTPIGRRLENPGPLDTRRRQLLLATSRWRLALAHLDRVRMMTPGTPDRAADLIAAGETLKRMSPGGLGEELRHARSRLQVLVARREHDFTLARKLLDSARFEDDDGLLAERLWVELDDQKPTLAWQLIQKRLARPSPLSDELLYLAQASRGRLWRTAVTNTLATQADDLWTRWLVASQRAIAVPDAYWRTRAKSDRDLLVAIERLGPELAHGQHRAISLYQAGRDDEALKAFAEVIRIALKSGQPELAGDLAFTRGSVMVKVQRYAEASVSFRGVIDQQPVHPKAAAAHLLWAWCLGQVDRKQTTAARHEAYHQALVQHRTRYPRHNTTAEATWLLAALQHQQQHTARARALWLEIPQSHARSDTARRLVGESFEAEAAGMDPADPARGRRLELAISSLDQLVTQLPGPPLRWSPDQAALAISLARLGLKPTRPDYRRVDQLLELVLTRGPAVTGTAPDPRAVVLRDSARQLRVLSLAGQGRLDDARGLIANFAGRPADLLALLDGLDRVAVTTRPTDRRRLGELQLQAAQTLEPQRKSLRPEDLRRLDRCMAQAYVAAGLPLRAAALYQDLVKRTPKDWRLRFRLAEIRVVIGTADQLKIAVNDWLLAERLLKAGSDDWMTVRLQTLKTLQKNGQLKKCRQLLSVTQLLYPDGGTNAVRADLKRLAEQLQSRRQSPNS